MILILIFIMWGDDYGKSALTYCALFTQNILLRIYEIHCGKILVYFLQKKIDNFFVQFSVGTGNHILSS